MKNRKIVIVAFLLVSILLLGIGYAVVTNVLDIQGSASVNASVAEDQFNEDIYFTGIVVNNELKENGVVASDNLGYTANINTNNNDKAQFTVTGLTEDTPSYSITYRIKNDSAHAATVSLKTLTNTDNQFGIDYYFGSETNKTATIQAEGTIDVTVVVSLAAQLTGAASGSFVIELNVTAGADETTAATDTTEIGQP